MTGRPNRAAEPEVRRILSEAECRAVADRIFGFAKGGGRTEVIFHSWWSGETRWSRNRVNLASDRRDLSLSVMREIGTAYDISHTNQLDDVSLEAAVRDAEANLRLRPRVAEDRRDPPPKLDFLAPKIWSETTLGLDTATRRDVCRAMVQPAEQKNLLSAGYLEVHAGCLGRFTSEGGAIYGRATRAQCSTTVRNPKGTGSGWAGLSSYDWVRIDPQVLGSRALEKCLTSQDPVAVEPGRYTVILEPQAVGDLVKTMFERSIGFDRSLAESGTGPYVLRPDFSKLGLKLVDERVTIDHDPMDPELAVYPFADGWEPVRPVTWIERGVLTNLPYDRRYALMNLNEHLPRAHPKSFRMSGGETSLEEMIKTTTRGLLVTRFSNVAGLDPGSMLLTGVTRDGLWLIEHGKITKAVKNFRFTESPVFMLNSLEQLGRPVPIFSTEATWMTPIVVPPLKAKDFSFTSMADAV